MPSHVPRNEPTRKKEQLLDCSENLRLAILHGKSKERIEKLAERFRSANLSLLKAKMHALTEMEIQGKNVESNMQKLEREKKSWEHKELDRIILEFNTMLANGHK